MIKRIVKMTFLEGNETAFLDLFDQVQKSIISFNGCHSLELVRNMHERNIFFTISEWENEEALHEYRKSALFGETWPKTKALFAQHAEVWSTESIAKLNE